jgi:hypothetical protein
MEPQTVRHSSWPFIIDRAHLRIRSLQAATVQHRSARTVTSLVTSHHTGATIRPGLLAQAEAAATRIRAAERRISRRSLRAAGLHASNAELGKLALKLTNQPPR